MSQKNHEKDEINAADKWREIEEEADANEKLLEDESSANVLKDKVNLLEKQIEAYQDQIARTQAELVNTSRRLEQEVAKARKFGAERVIADLVPVIDSLVHGLASSPATDAQTQSMRHGMELTLDLLSKTLEKNGVLAIDPKAGDAFDPTQHEAMSMRSEPGATPNTVLQVLQKGYALNGRVIRAAMVIVAA